MVLPKIRDRLAIKARVGVGIELLRIDVEGMVADAAKVDSTKALLAVDEVVLLLRRRIEAVGADPVGPEADEACAAHEEHPPVALQDLELLRLVATHVTVGQAE